MVLIHAHNGISCSYVAIKWFLASNITKYSRKRENAEFNLLTPVLRPTWPNRTLRGSLTGVEERRYQRNDAFYDTESPGSERGSVCADA